MTTFQQKHGRPKPPEIWDGGYWDRARYEIDHPHVLTVCKVSESPLWAVCSKVHGSRTFPTHAEAINWAQKHARNRNESGGEISGA